MAAVHEVKSWPQFFRSVVSGERRHELRRDDRGYAVGDRVRLREFEPDSGEYTGSEFTVEITSITSDDVPCAVSAEGLHPGFCILTVRPLLAEADGIRRP